MKLILFIIVMINTSWQQESTETLNETLDRLIKQASSGDQPKANITTIPNTKKTSRIIYFNSPDSKTEPHTEDKLNGSIINTGDDKQLNIVNILHALGLKLEDNKNKEFDIANGAPHSVYGDKEPSDADTYDTELKGLLDQLISKTKNTGNSGSSSDIPASVSADTGNELIHNYPEIIIDKITYHDNNNKYSDIKTKRHHEDSGVITTVTEHQNYKTSKESSEKNHDFVVAAQELKSLLEELKKLKATETETKNDHTTSFPIPITQNKVTQEIQPCVGTPIAYASQCKDTLMDKMEYSRSNDADLNRNLPLNVWGPRNARQIELMRIARVQKLKRIKFITQLINNMMAKFVYRPLYGFY